MNNVEIIERLFRAVEARDLEPMFDIYAPDVVINEAPSLPYGGSYRGHEGVAEHGGRYVQAWDELQTEHDRDLEAEFVAGQDRVLVCWRQKGHGRDGQPINVPVISEYRLRDGRVVESRMHTFDSAALVRFLADQNTGTGADDQGA